MAHESPLARVARLSAANLGVFRGHDAVEHGLSRKQLSVLKDAGVITRVHPDTYRIESVAQSNEQHLRAALAWAGDQAAAAGRSAGEVYRLEGVRASKPEIVAPRKSRSRAPSILLHHSDQRSALMIRGERGIPITGIEPTLLWLAHSLDAEDLEIACEDARRRHLTSIPALNAYLNRWARRGRPGVAAMRRLLAELDPNWPARSVLEVKTRRLLMAHGMTNFAREFPLDWKGRTYSFDFAFLDEHVILEVNGRKWHDDPNDYERDNEKWSVPGRHGFRIVFATWAKVVEKPTALLEELEATLTRPDAGAS